MRHGPIVEHISDALRVLGCQARVEGSFVGIYREEGRVVAPGRLDLYAFGQAGLMEVMVDVAVKHSCAGPLERHAAKEDGYVAKLAEREQLKEYIMLAGKVLTPFGVETFGRLGKAAEGAVGQAAACGNESLQAQGWPYVGCSGAAA